MNRSLIVPCRRGVLASTASPESKEFPAVIEADLMYLKGFSDVLVAFPDRVEALHRICNRPLLGRWTGSVDQLAKESELKRPFIAAAQLYATPHGSATV
mmetsp:Transcript_10997/g.23320  ORF Transcript_10997/g.23320 Transcript_10997/m.23320 type:complete len:99 (+) Transcript_10997:735-1031(+)